MAQLGKRMEEAMYPVRMYIVHLLSLRIRPILAYRVGSMRDNLTMKSMIVTESQNLTDSMTEAEPI